MRPHEFRQWLLSTYIGPFVIAMFIIGTIQASILTVRNPLSLLLANAINGLPKRGLFIGMRPLPLPIFMWQSTLQIAVNTVIFAAIAVLIGRWVYTKDGKASATP